MPRFSLEAKSPEPKTWAQRRLMITREASGFFGSVSQRARPRRFFGKDSFQGKM